MTISGHAIREQHDWRYMSQSRQDNRYTKVQVCCYSVCYVAITYVYGRLTTSSYLHVGGVMMMCRVCADGTCTTHQCFRKNSQHPQLNPTIIHTYNPTEMTTLAESICKTFNPSIFAKVRELWFGNVADDTQLILPPSNLIKQWFASYAEFDEICRCALPSIHSYW